MDRHILEGLLAEGLSLGAIGRRLGCHESTVAYWLGKHGLRANDAEKYAGRGGLPKEQMQSLVEEGLSIAQIAARVDRSKGTVRHWLQRYGLKTWSPSGSRRKAESSEALAAGLREATMACARHGETEFVIDGRGHYRCRRCRAEAVSRRRRKMKRILVEEAGGRCGRCGYSNSMRALHFHHVDPSEKRLELNAKGVALSLETLRAEARKCILLCSNCHAELEDRIRLNGDEPDRLQAEMDTVVRGSSMAE